MLPKIYDKTTERLKIDFFKDKNIISNLLFLNNMALFRNVITRIPKQQVLRSFGQPSVRTFRTVIPVDKDGFNDELYNIKCQKGIGYFAWLFYPGIDLIFQPEIPFGIFAFVCSSFHFTMGRSIIEQIGVKYWDPQYMGMKYWINWDNELVIESPKLSNLYWPKYPHGGLTLKQNVINHIDQTKEEKEHSITILAQRRYRFWLSMGNVINYFVMKGVDMALFKHKYPSSDIMETFTHNVDVTLLISFMSYTIPFMSYTLGYFMVVRYPKTSLLDIYSSKHKYYYIDTYGNIVLTNQLLGFRNRELTVFTPETTPNERLPIEGGKLSD